jgi:hypothetical protein
MTLDTILKAMFYAPSVAILGLSALMVGALVLSYLLNDQTWPSKARNALKLSTGVYGVAAYYSLLAFMEQRPLPVSLWLATTAALVAILLGDVLGLLLRGVARRRTLSVASATLERLAKKVNSPHPPKWWIPVGVGLILIAVSLACSTDLEPQTPTGEPTRDITPVETGEPTASPTATATAEPSPTSTATLPAPDDTNLLRNPGFEGEVEWGDGGAVSVEWQRFYCNTPYTETRCAVPILWNPYDPYMKTPEYNLAPQPARVHGGETAQHLFAASGVTDAGVYQDVAVTPGAYYTLTFYGQMWLADGPHQTSNGEWADQGCYARDATNTCIDWLSTWYTSDVATEDDLNAGWIVGGVGSCESNAFAENGLYWGRPYGFYDGLYDAYAPVEVDFQAWDDCVRVYLRFWTKYSKGHNDAFIDDASLVLATFEAGTPEPTPTPIIPREGTPTPTPAPGETPEPTPSPDSRTYDPAIRILEPPQSYIPDGNWHIRADHSKASLSVGGLIPGEPVEAFAIWSAANGDLWICLDPDWAWIENPDFNLYILQCGRWTAWRFAGDELGDWE